MKIKLKHGLYLNKSPAEVFAFLCDPDLMLHWQSSMFEIKGKSKANAHGKLQKGTKVHDRRKVLGKEIDGEWEVVEFDQDKRLVLRVASGPVAWQTTYTLEPHEGGTFLSAEGGGDLGNVPVPPGAAHRSCQLLFQQDLNTLADILEK